jgi:hypothetical protein
LAIEASGVLVQGNDLGVSAGGGSLGAVFTGILISGNGNTIGGTVSGAANTIACGAEGVTVESNSADNSILGNSISDNGQGNPPHALGIDLNGSGNDDQPSPVLTSASLNTTTNATTVLGTVSRPRWLPTYRAPEVLPDRSPSTTARRHSAPPRSWAERQR